MWRDGPICSCAIAMFVRSTSATAKPSERRGCDKQKGTPSIFQCVTAHCSYISAGCGSCVLREGAVWREEEMVASVRNGRGDWGVSEGVCGRFSGEGVCGERVCEERVERERGSARWRRWRRRWRRRVRLVQRARRVRCVRRCAEAGAAARRLRQGAAKAGGQRSRRQRSAARCRASPRCGGRACQIAQAQGKAAAAAPAACRRSRAAAAH